MKIAAVVLVVIAVLFIAGSTLQLREQRELDGDAAESWERFQVVGSLEPGYLSGPCVAGREIVIRAGGSCVVPVSRAWWPRRDGTLRLVSGPELTITYDPPHDALDRLTARLTPGAGIEVSVYRQGGLLELACAVATGGGDCRVRLE